MSHSRSPSPPTITRHSPGSILPTSLPTPGLVRSVAEAAHYSGPVRRPSQSERTRASFGRGVSDEDISEGRRRVLSDLKEVSGRCRARNCSPFSDFLLFKLFCSRPTLEILERTWRPDAVFEVLAKTLVMS